MPASNDSPARGASDIVDLRSTMEFHASIPGQLVSTKAEVDPYLELAGVYKLVGAGTPVAPPTRIGPAMLFENVKGYDMPVLTGTLASRERVALMLGSSKERLAFDLLKAVDNPVPTAQYPGPVAPCQEVVIKPPFDMRKLIPATVSTEKDGGPFLNLGLLWAEDPETGVSDVTIHRMGIQGPDHMSVSFTPGRHIDAFRAKAHAMGKPLALTVNMGLDPAILLAACFEPPTTPMGFDELTVAGALRGRPVELVDCVTVAAKAIARAEVVLECEIMPDDFTDEDALTHGGYCMPEFPGYVGPAQKHNHVIRVRTITHRLNPIFQILVGPGEEHVSLAGIPTEASIFRLIESSMPGLLKNVYCPSAGGGKYLAILQINKRTAYDEGRHRQAALAAFTSFSELKHVILVDDDVDLYDTSDVLWAMTTRFQGDVSTVFVPGVRCHPLDPSSSPEFNPMLRGMGIACKTIFDCTAPWAMKERFERTQFVDVDLSRFLPDGWDHA
jgi:UbiD family decarboxylase